MEQINKKAIQIASQKLHISEEEATRHCKKLERYNDAYRVETDKIGGPFVLIDAETECALVCESVYDYQIVFQKFHNMQMEKIKQINTGDENANNKKKGVLIGLIAIIIIVAVMALPALGVRWLWNSFVVDMFSVEPISFWVAWLISAVLGTLFGGFSITIKRK